MDETAHQPPRRLVSAVVVSYNREALVGTCLEALAFADEVLVVDKSSTDATREIAARFADRIVQVPWSPTVEGTRAFAVAQCTHDWVLLLDDDECLNPEAALFIVEELRHPRASAYSFPLRHYILGVHDEAAYYWPERQIRLFRRDAAEIGTMVHGGISAASGDVFDIPIESNACIHHLSHADATQWIEKTNRYTSQIDPLAAPDDAGDLLTYAHARLDYWNAQGAGPTSAYTAAVATLRAVYDIVARIKAAEKNEPVPGASLLQAKCRELERDYAARLRHLKHPRAHQNRNTPLPPVCVSKAW